MAFRLTPWSGRKGQSLPARREEQQRDPFAMLRREMNRLIDDFNRGFGFDITPFGESAEEGAGLWVPRVNVTESEKEVAVSAELPGLDEKNIEVSVSDNVLSIKGEKRDESEEKGRNFYRMERSFGSFRREIPLPAEVEVDKADAKFCKGVLTITIPKSKEAQKEVKKIAVAKS